MINQVDVFVFYEDVQYTRKDWRNRNRIKTPSGLKWLTVPIKKAPRETKIFEIEIDNSKNWQQSHYNLIKQNYSTAPFFEKYHFLLEGIYLKNKWKNLSEMNIYITKLIAQTLRIVDVKYCNSQTLKIKETEKNDKIIKICKKMNADCLLDGPAAKQFISIEKFEKENIGLEYIKYDYPEYDQLHGDFDHYVSVLDLIFNCGKESSKYIFQGKTEKAI